MLRIQLNIIHLSSGQGLLKPSFCAEQAKFVLGGGFGSDELNIRPIW